MLKQLWQAWLKARAEKALKEVQLQRIYFMGETAGLQRYLDEREAAAREKLARFA